MENENKVNDFDIFGILSYQNYNKSLEGIKKIKRIKPLDWLFWHATTIDTGYTQIKRLRTYFCTLAFFILA